MVDTVEIVERSLQLKRNALEILVAALIIGLWTPAVATVAFLMVLNFHVASGALFRYAFLTNGYGLPVLAGTLARISFVGVLMLALLLVARTRVARVGRAALRPGRAPGERCWPWRSWPQARNLTAATRRAAGHRNT